MIPSIWTSCQTAEKRPDCARKGAGFKRLNVLVRSAPRGCVFGLFRSQALGRAFCGSIPEARPVPFPACRRMPRGGETHTHHETPKHRLSRRKRFLRGALRRSSLAVRQKGRRRDSGSNQASLGLLQALRREVSRRQDAPAQPLPPQLRRHRKARSLRGRGGRQVHLRELRHDLHVSQGHDTQLLSTWNGTAANPLAIPWRRLRRILLPLVRPEVQEPEGHDPYLLPQASRRQGQPPPERGLKGTRPCRQLDFAFFSPRSP